MAAAQTAQELLKLIEDSVKVLAPAAAPLDTPLSAEQMKPPPYGAVPDVALDALATFQAAMGSLFHLVAPAPLAMTMHVFSFHTTAAIRVAMHARAAEILRDQPQGMDVRLSLISGAVGRS